MNTNLPKKYKDNFISNIFRKLKLIFFNKKINEEIISENNIEINSNTEKNNNFIEQLKDYEKVKNTEYEKQQFMRKLTDNPSLLEYFSNDRLEEILKYYLNENEKKRNILKSI